MTWKIKFKEDPLIQIIQIALELWVRSQCKSLSEIKIDIHGSTSDILSGNISRTKVEASNVNFKNISLEKVELIDRFEGGKLPHDKCSLAYRLWFREKAKTLTDDEVLPIQTKIRNELTKAFNAELRS